MKDFKKGDKVRVIIEDWQQNFDMGDDLGTVRTGDVGEVLGPSWDGEDVEVGFYGGVVRMNFAEDEIELVRPYDPKTAFLEELQNLLRKYNACIYDYEQYKLCIDFANGDSISWYWGDKPIKESYLTSDNIFNYDKEYNL